MSHAEPFGTVDQQRDAARLGMLVFLASEVLLFAGLFALWAAYRTEWLDGFHAAARRTNWWLALVNTGVLLTASFAVALGVQARRAGGAHRTGFAVGAGLGVVFLALKGLEWGDHLSHGLVPGGHAERGEQVFFTLYYAATGLHAAHVAIGVAVLAALAARRDPPHVVENGAAYWHLVDAIWLFLWPMFYLMRGGG